MKTGDELTYWEKRQLRILDKYTKKTTKEIEDKLREYYRRAMEKVISDFAATYNKLLVDSLDREPTPADLYKLDAYWHMQKQLRDELTKLGDKQAALLSRTFESYYGTIYENTALPSGRAYSTISTASARQQINSVWLADGKTYSQRIWGNVEHLTESLNDNLINCVVTGRQTRELVNKLRLRFNASYSQARTLVHTEIAHIQTQAAAQRYKDAGIKRYKFLGREQEDGCGHEPDCHDLNGKKFYMAEMRVGVNCPPMHPNCGCAIAAVLEGYEQ